MDQLLYNPVYEALLSGNRHLSQGSDTVKYFEPEVSPFVGFADSNRHGFEELQVLLPPERKIIYATPRKIDTPPGWQLVVAMRGLQFVLPDDVPLPPPSLTPLPLSDEHVPQMVDLATLTKPGPFGSGTIRFGHYYGFFENSRLAAMTGQRLHVHTYAEISAVCTHPDSLGKGYATILVQHQAALMRQQGHTPFLHVRADNDRAIALYKRLGFTVTREMNFYFLRREGSVSKKADLK